MYGIIYGMKRTTIYLPHGLKRAIEREAARQGTTEAEVIRSAVRAHLDAEPERPLNLPLFPEGFGEDLATGVDLLLEKVGDEP
jgi:hypothetical protein